MKRTAEFWMRISITLFFILLVLSAPIIFFPFGISLILSILLTPLAQKLYKWINMTGIKNIPYDIPIIISFGIFIGIIYLIAIHIFVPFITELRAFTRSIPATFSALQSAIPELEAAYHLSLLPAEAQGFIAKMIQEIGEYTLRLAQFSLSAIFSFASTVIELIVVPFITFYMMKKGGTFSNKFAELFPERYHAHIKNLFKEIHFVLKAYIHGQLLLSVLMAFLVFIGMWIMDIPYPLVIGLLAGVVEMVPIIGPIIGAVPPILLGLLQGSSVMTQVIIFYVVVQQLDSHFIMPKLMGSIIEVHPVAIIAGVLIGGSLKGILGMMIAVPAVAVLQILLRHMWYYDRYKVLR